MVRSLFVTKLYEAEIGDDALLAERGALILRSRPTPRLARRGGNFGCRSWDQGYDQSCKHDLFPP